MNSLESDLAQYIIQNGSVVDGRDAKSRREMLEGKDGEMVARELLYVLGPYRGENASLRQRVDVEELRMYLVGWLGLMETELR